MVFLEPNRTAYDLSWRMFGIEVRVHPMFWLMSALLGWPVIELGLQYLLLWIGCVFVSVLVHELGHVVAGRYFGSAGNIVLYGFGGLAIGSSALARRWQRNIVYFAGPLAGFLLLGLILVAVFVGLPAAELPPRRAASGWDLFGLLVQRLAAARWPALLTMAVIFLTEINLFWGLLNLLPVWPLDGGRISRETFEWLMPARGTLMALGISVVVAGLLAINALAAHAGRPFLPYVPAGGLYSAFFFGMLALASFQLYQAESQRSRWRGDESAPWERSDERDEDRDDWRR